MRCDEARERLSEARYGAEPDAALQSHLDSCEACRAAQTAEVALDAWLAKDDPLAPRPGFDTRFFARLDAERARARKRRWTAFGVALVPIAAAVALIVVRRAEPGAETPRTAPTHATAASLPPEVAQEDLELALDLELVEELEVVQHIDELEAFDALADVDERELEALLEEAP